MLHGSFFLFQDVGARGTLFTVIPFLSHSIKQKAIQNFVFGGYGQNNQCSMALFFFFKMLELEITVVSVPRITTRRRDLR